MKCMPITTYNDDGSASWMIGTSFKHENFPFLKDSEILEREDGEEDYHMYDLDELRTFTLSLMHYLHIPYDSRVDRSKESRTKLSEFTEEEKSLYYPFAFILACLDGNAFRVGHLNSILENGETISPSPETINQYIPDAYNIINANSGDLDEIRDIIFAARDGALKHKDNS